jgi:CDP-diglyceride synthetase
MYSKRLLAAMCSACCTVPLCYNKHTLTDKHNPLCAVLPSLIAIMLQVSMKVWWTVLILAAVCVLFLLQCAWNTMQKQKQSKSKVITTYTMLPLLLLPKLSPLLLLVMSAQYNQLSISQCSNHVSCIEVLMATLTSSLHYGMLLTLLLPLLLHVHIRCCAGGVQDCHCRIVQAADAYDLLVLTESITFM